MTTFQFIAVGTSLGGFHALETVLGGLPKDFPLPLGVVQHRRSEDSEALTCLLAGCTQLPVIEVEDKQKIEDRSGLFFSDCAHERTRFRHERR